MSIIHEDCPVMGYSEGLIKSDEQPKGEFTDRGDLPKGNMKNYNLWFTIGDTRYNVHDYRHDLCGWPIRWTEKVTS